MAPSCYNCMLPLFLYLFCLFFSCRPDGITFTVAKADCVLPMRPVRGDVVTFTHDFVTRRAEAAVTSHDAEAQGDAARDEVATQYLVRGVPSNAIVHRIRSDVSWEDVVRNASVDIRQFLNGTSLPSLLILSHSLSLYKK
jgi:hypothetical protein